MVGALLRMVNQAQRSRLRHVRAPAPPWVLLLPLAFAACAASGSRILSIETYRTLPHEEPWIVDAECGGGVLTYYGAMEHEPPDDTAFCFVERMWEVFRPQLVLLEGGLQAAGAHRDEAVRGGEAGLLRFLAASGGVPVGRLDPAPAAELAALQSEFTVEQLRVFQALRAVVRERRREPAERAAPAVLVGRELEQLTRSGFAGAPATPAEFAASCGRLLPQLEAWSEVPAEWVDPAAAAGPVWLREIAQAACARRDRHMVEAIVREVQAGKRVFALTSASHVFMQEPELRARLRVTSAGSIGRSPPRGQPGR